MGFFEKFMEAWMPACLSFGPLFLVVSARNPKGERFLRITGVIMVSAALITLWLMVSRQRGEISILQTRIHYLEEKVRGGAATAAGAVAPAANGEAAN